VIDTGFDFKGKWDIQPKICPTGHKDLTGQGLQDVNGHGTHIAGLIAKYAGDADYCLVIIKFFHNDLVKGDTLQASIDAINHAVDQKVDIINLSMGGVGYSNSEYKAVKRALDDDITIIAAAGNEGKDFKKQPYYPALYDDRIIVVAAVDKRMKRMPSSNYGVQVDAYELGENVLSTMPHNSYGHLTGTSQATAIHTGKFVQHLYKVKKLYDYVAPKYLKKRTLIVA
jgi:subtilisin family serine protease